jgi:hypothetical protein
MNKLCCFIILFVGCGVCEGQNLVPNGDFEQYIGCPDWPGQIDSALFWFRPTNSPTSYFNQCSPNVYGNVPVNYFGFQYAHSGVAYGGIQCWNFNSFWRDYLEVPLTSTLISNQCYHLEMYLNIANECEYTSDAIGVYFSDTAMTGLPWAYLLNFVPQIDVNMGLNTDTLNWIQITGNFTANGGENYIIIGNFKNDAQTTSFLFNNLGLSQYSFFYIDDVSLSPCSGMEEQNSNTKIIIYPNPIMNKLNIEVNNKELSEIVLYDITSRKIFHQTFTNSISINTGQLSKGIYIYEVRNKNGVIKKGKVVKE